jgi:hypothetical protein
MFGVFVDSEGEQKIARGDLRQQFAIAFGARAP